MVLYQLIIKKYFEYTSNLKLFQLLVFTTVAYKRAVIQQLTNQRVALNGPLVLTSNFKYFLMYTVDWDQTVSRRSKPSSRSTLIGEQPNPW